MGGTLWAQEGILFFRDDRINFALPMYMQTFREIALICCLGRVYTRMTER